MEIGKLAQQFKISEGYCKVAVDAWKNDENLDIENSTLTHAKFLMYLLIEKAKDIKIFSGNLDKKCYDDPAIKEVLKLAKKNNAKIEILSESKDVPKIFSELKINITTLDKQKVKPEYKHFLNNHFMVCDSKSYRLEVEHKPDDIDFVNAKVNFNDPSFASYLINLFKNLSPV